MISPETRAYIDQTAASLRAEIARAPGVSGKQITLPPPRHFVNFPAAPSLFKATADATWNSTDGRWEVEVERVGTDGATGSPETIACVGADGDDAPVLLGDLCVEVMSRDNRSVVVPMGATYGLLVGTPGWVLGRKLVDPDDSTEEYEYGWVETVTHASQHPEAE